MKKRNRAKSFHFFVLNCKYNTRFIVVIEILIKQVALDFIPDSDGQKRFFARKRKNVIALFRSHHGRN